MRGTEYDEFIESFVTAVTERWPNILLQWEDFAKGNADRLLTRYPDRLCTFNDDIRGRPQWRPRHCWPPSTSMACPLTEQRIVVLAAGSAGCGIAALLLQAMIDACLKASEAQERFFVLNSRGLLLEGMPDVGPAQKPFLQPRDTSGRCASPERSNFLTSCSMRGQPLSSAYLASPARLQSRSCARWLAMSSGQ
jgi:malate dehydrogenase (oxaloacetate-decarboxylating)